MSHIQTLSDLKETCQSTGECEGYDAQTQREIDEVNAYTANANQSAVTWGALVVIVGLVILLTPFVKPIQRFQRFLLPKLAIVAPIVIGLLVGAFIGFIVTFSACFKQSCSPMEESAIFTIPALSLVISIPLTTLTYKKRKSIANSVTGTKPIGWIIVGALIILLSITKTIGTVNDNNRYNSSQKEYLRTLER